MLYFRNKYIFSTFISLVILRRYSVKKSIDKIKEGQKNKMVVSLYIEGMVVSLYIEGMVVSLFIEKVW